MARAYSGRALTQSWAGRLLLAGLAIRIASWIAARALSDPPPFLSLVDVLSTLAALSGAMVLGIRRLRGALRSVLWRVRRKLIISYVLIGVIPVVLVAAFCLLGALLIFFNFSSYLLQSRLRSVAARADSIAETTALEIQNTGAEDVRATLARRIASVTREFPGASMAMVPMDRTCSGRRIRNTQRVVTSGIWTHVEAPNRLPEWITCDGFTGALVYAPPAGPGDAPAGDRPVELLVRAVAFPEETTGPLFAVVVDLLIDTTVGEQFRRETGVELTGVNAETVPGQLEPLDKLASEPDAVEATVDEGGMPLNWLSVFEYYDWSNGQRGRVVTSLRVRIGEIYRTISTEGFSGPRVGWALLVALGAVGALFLIIESAALFMGLALARSITGSIHDLFVGTERVRQGDLTHPIAVTADDQLGELASSFNAMTDSIRDLLVQSAEKKRLEEELRIAHGIQMSLLPHGPLDVPGLSISAACVPAREVGGDYYDLLRIDNDRVGILIADVAGKGTFAALYMAELKGLMLSLSRIHTSPRALLIDANQIIREHLGARSFITMIYAIVDVRRRTMTYARAGHTPLLHIRRVPGAPPQARLLAPDGLVLGLTMDQEGLFERLIEEETLPLETGDLFVLFTDGISEAMNAADECFGESRLSRLVESLAGSSLHDVQDRVLSEIARFVGEAPQHDDMTLILMQVEPAEVGPDAVRVESVVSTI